VNRLPLSQQATIVREVAAMSHLSEQILQTIEALPAEDQQQVLRGLP
jgi:hypothetical protein